MGCHDCLLHSPPADKGTHPSNDPQSCFSGFTESPINFAPTFKYDVLKLKRTKTLQRSNTAMSGVAPSGHDRRAAKHTSAPASGLAGLMSPSRSTLPQDGVVEEAEEDDDDDRDRQTVASSRASISSAFSGFETVFDDDGNPVDRSGRDGASSSAGYFGSSPSTPAADRLVEKAKGFFNLMRTKSHSSHSSTSAGPNSLRPLSPRVDRGNRPMPSPTPSQYALPAAPGSSYTSDSSLQPPPRFTDQAGTSLPTGMGNGGLHFSSNLPSANSSALSLGSESAGGSGMDDRLLSTSQAPPLQQPPRMTQQAAADRPSRPSLTIDPPSDAQRSVTPVSVTLSPATSPRPRLYSARSTATIFSFASRTGGGGGAGGASDGAGKDAGGWLAHQQAMQAMTQEERDKQLEDDSVFDTSSKQRVQSWTDRILYKSTIRPPPSVVEPEAEEEAGTGRHGVGSTIIDSLRGMKRTLTGHQMHASSAPAHGAAPPTVAMVGSGPSFLRKNTQQRVSFQQPVSPLPAEHAQTHTQIHSPLYTRKNTSSSSLHSQTPGSQQRLNHRFAKLFTRHSSTQTITASSYSSSACSPRHSSDLATDLGSPITRPTSPASVSVFASGPGSPTSHGGPPKLSRSFSSQSRLGGSRRRQSGQQQQLLRPSSAGAGASPADAHQQQRVRTKPRRSYTSPNTSRAPSPGVISLPTLSLPLAQLTPADASGVSPPLPSASTAASGATTVTVRPARVDSPDDSLTPMPVGAGARSRAMSDASHAAHGSKQDERGSTPTLSGLAPASQAMSRPGSAPHAMLSPHGPTSLLEAHPELEEGSRNGSAAGAGSARRTGFAFHNPFAGFTHIGSGPGSSFEDRPPGASASSRLHHASSEQQQHGAAASARTGIPLSYSRTTPIVPGGAADSAGGHSGSTFGIRQWWHTHLVPFLSSAHHEHAGLHDPSALEAALSLDKDLPHLPDDDDNHDEQREWNQCPPPPPPEPVLVGPRRGEVMTITYDAIADLRRMQACSDHRPVVAVYALGV